MNDPQRILIVDDNEANRDILETRLKVHGYELLQAADGEEALAAVQRDHPDLILPVSREDVDDPVDRLRRRRRMQRSEDEVPGLRRGERQLDRLQIAHLADEDDIGIFA